MALPRHIFAPAFRHQKLSVFFAGLVCIVVYVATFATAAEATLSALTMTWDKGVEARMTVEIPHAGDEASQAQSDKVQQAVALLRAMPELATVTPVPDEETIALLKPWIDNPEVLKAIPVPSLIDITRKEGVSLTPADVLAKLKPVAEDARVDEHAAWLSDAQHLVRGLSIMAFLMIGLTAVTLVIAVSLVCRAIMATEKDTITLLHTMGAEDRDIARHFQFHARRLAAPAAWLGFGLALLSSAILLFFLRHIASAASLQPMHWLVLAVMTLLVPVLAVWIAAFSARLSTLKLLHALP
ncbi:MAG TPA: FtsX-like permease family protein [Alphaproteobacteria bacterium]|nr:FtsX-like permease family protein [Alphaproteobacteria bacterium]